MGVEEYAEGFFDVPDLLQELGPEDADGVLSFTEGMRERFQSESSYPVVEIDQSNDMPYLVYFVGDIHGDLMTARRIMSHYKRIKASMSSKGRLGLKTGLVFLGDYIDRAPKDTKNGGLLTILYLLSVKAIMGDEVTLLRGNHEGARLMSFSPYELPLEINDVFGGTASQDIHDSLMDLFDRLPLFARTSNGLLASHAGFPKGNIRIEDIGTEDEKAILQTIWGDPSESGTYRGDISKDANFTEDDLVSFLKKQGCRMLIRGHDYKTLGYSMYSRKVLTLHTSRRYEKRGRGGMLLARCLVHPKKEIKDADDLKLLRIEGSKMEGIPIEDFRT